MPTRPPKHRATYAPSAAPKQQRHADYDRTRGSAAERGYDATWQAFRGEVLKERGHRCEKCGATEGRLYLDHIVELRDGGARLDRRNVQVLDARCHTLKTAAEKRRRGR
jgi:5-methylcytosine-specific restriction endonuclease McrA